MKSSTEVFHRAGRERLALTVLCAVLFCSASTLLAEPAPSPKRFLFIVDTSASMKPFEGAVRETIFDSINSGFRGQMTNGDTYGIWLVNEQNDTSFRMEMWKKKFSLEMAAKAATHVKDHGFKGKFMLNQAMADLAAVANRVTDLTVILVSNGETPIAGTPFDDIINLRFRELAPSMKRAKAALTTIFAVQDGRLVAWAANSPDTMMSFPNVPPRPKPVKVEVVLGTNEPPPIVKTAKSASPVQAEPAPLKPHAILPSIIITKESVALERKSYVSATTILPTNESAGAALVTNAAVTSTAPTNAVATADTKPGAEVTNGVAPQKPAVIVSVPANGTAAHLAATKDEATRAVEAPPGVAPAATVKVSAAESVTSRPAPAWLWALIGASVALTVVLGIFLFWRSRRQEPSLISQSQTLAREQVS